MNHYIQFAGYGSNPYYYFCYENSTVYKLEVCVSVPNTYTITALIMGLSSLISIIGLALTHFTISLINLILLCSTPILITLMLIYAIRSIKKRQSIIDFNVENFGIETNFSKEELLNLCRKSWTIYLKCVSFAMICLLLSLAGLFVYLFISSDMRLLIASILGIPAGVGLLMFFEPIKKLRVYLYFKKQV